MNSTKLSRPVPFIHLKTEKMKPNIFCLYALFIITTLIPLDYAGAELGFRSNSKVSTPDITSTAIVSNPSSQLNQSTSKNSINSSSKGIQIHFRDYSLGKILKNIHDETGINFNLSPRMEKKRINVDIQAKHWKSLVKKLITDYSRVEVWTDQSKTSQIWIVESNSYN
jgi:hypothetical protein